MTIIATLSPEDMAIRDSFATEAMVELLKMGFFDIHSEDVSVRSGARLQLAAASYRMAEAMMTARRYNFSQLSENK